MRGKLLCCAILPLFDGFESCEGFDLLYALMCDDCSVCTCTSLTRLVVHGRVRVCLETLELSGDVMVASDRVCDGTCPVSFACVCGFHSLFSPFVYERRPA